VSDTSDLRRCTYGQVRTIDFREGRPTNKIATAMGAQEFVSEVPLDEPSEIAYLPLERTSAVTAVSATDERKQIEG
jgi:hypothetical protein